MKNKSTLLTTGLLGFTVCSGLVLTSIRTYADDSVTSNASVTVPVSCMMASNVNTAHNATIDAGTYSGSSAAYANGIGKTTLTTYCNDNNGFSIYAVGFTGDSYDDANHTKLVGTSASGNATISTKAYEPGDTASNWSMKITKINDSTQSYNPANMSIKNSFDSWHAVPDAYTQVVEYKATTGSSVTDQSLGAKVETTYASYIAPTQPADVYVGKVKYTMVHPYNMDARHLNVTYNANGFYFNNDPSKTTNLVTYDASAHNNTEDIVKHARSIYNEDGTFNNYGVPGGNSVVTIPEASNLHIKVTYGVPEGSAGPPSDLYIWSGNHPNYTYTNGNTSLTNCGSTSAVSGAFHSSGNSGSQVTIECDIADNSVTFYDYSITTSGSLSTGYYAVVTSIGDTTTYSKSVVGGSYSVPVDTSGSHVFLGWTTNPDNQDHIYTNETEVIAGVPYTNEDITVTLYAAWIPVMQNLSPSSCTAMPIRAIDIRDNQVYSIARLADGKCWMIDNLNLSGGTAFSADNTDVISTYIDNFTTSNNLVKDGDTIVLPVSVARNPNNYDLADNSQFKINNYSYVHNTGVTDNCGNTQNIPCTSYYSWDAATIGSGRTINTDGVDAPYSICPKGWKLPATGERANGGWKRGDFYSLATAYGVNLENSYYLENSTTFYNNAGPSTLPNFLLAGYYESSLFSRTANPNGTYWSSTSYSSVDRAHYFHFTGTSIDSADYWDRSFGNPVRCILDS